MLVLYYHVAMKMKFNTQSKKYRQYSLVILAVWVFSWFSHVAHSEILSQPELEIECHLCYGALDTHKDVDASVSYYQRFFRTPVVNVKQITVQQAAFTRPFMRAPPF